MTVCIRFLNNFTKRMKESGVDSSSSDRVEIEFLKACKEAKGKDERFVSILQTDLKVYQKIYFGDLLDQWIILWLVVIVGILCHNYC